MRRQIKKNKASVLVCEDATEVYKEAAGLFRRLSSLSMAHKQPFNVALSGGSTPEGLYRLLSMPPYKTEICWEKIHLFFGDERCVLEDSKDSNYKMVSESLLEKVPIPKDNIHRINAEEGKPGAFLYEKEIVDLFRTTGDIPSFDLILLGMGEDGHTASVFPQSHILEEKEKLVAWVAPASGRVARITFTPRLVLNAKNIVFIIIGLQKSERLKQVLEDEYNPFLLPSQIVRLAKGKVTWVVDKNAAARLAGHR